MDPCPPVSSARSKPEDVVPGRFVSLPSAPQARGSLLGSSHPRPRADPGKGASGGRPLWVVGTQGSHWTPWCGQLGGLSSVRSWPFVGALSATPTPTPPTAWPSPLARRGLAQMPSNSVSFLPFFGLASPWLELPMGWSHHIPSTNRKAALWTKRGFFFLTPTFEFSAFSDSHVIRIL